jgi:DNA-directed RNA polymerase subunit RPC12/RpoP
VVKIAYRCLKCGREFNDVESASNHNNKEHNNVAIFREVRE